MAMKRTFRKGDRVRSRHWHARESLGTVLGVGSRPGLHGPVPRCSVRWDATSVSSWVDEDWLEAA